MIFIPGTFPNQPWLYGHYTYFNTKRKTKKFNFWKTSTIGSSSSSWYWNKRPGWSFLVANSNSSFYGGWSRHTSKVERYRGSERFSKDERFLLMMGVSQHPHSAQWANRGVSLHSSDNDYTRPKGPFKNDSFATRGFQTLWDQSLPSSENDETVT